jgi:hypothetical protein
MAPQYTYILFVDSKLSFHNLVASLIDMLFSDLHINKLSA